MKITVAMAALALVMAIVCFVLGAGEAALLLLGFALLEALLAFNYHRRKKAGAYHPVHYEKTNS